MFLLILHLVQWHKKFFRHIQQQNPTKASYQSQQGTESENDPNNTTIFVGGLDSSVTDDLLRQLFSPYGELVHVKIPVGKRCGFVPLEQLRKCRRGPADAKWNSAGWSEVAIGSDSIIFGT
ncbi:hypothetical protein M5K25_000135 [Dendrobium thyrsiflorum]|uniref:RRM domain-containing protein n=1 Tax=Dendrobium thyrsiflorum TaxID=117978 RepID=A0ABD0VSU2_DENTH